MSVPDQDGPRGETSLTEVETCWTTVRTAHTPGPDGDRAMNELIGRYHDAIGRYLQIKLRDQNLADEVFQEFWTKLLSRKLAGADDSKGRFRDYLRTVLNRLIIDHFRGKKVQPLPPGELLDPSLPDADYDRVWRETLVKRVWTRLESFESSSTKNRYATVLHFRVNNPKAAIEELTLSLSKQLNIPISPEAFRKTLQRARTKFLELLVLELKETIHPATQEDIEAEIFDLGLGDLYRRYSAASST